ncbi:hypothetical protein [Algoriphagus boritolerans]|uniref:hypothetical protein n=1 Tax=Algoriphagus boritolerans TaxID=308111 RepID=UPI000A5841F2
MIEQSCEIFYGKSEGWKRSEFFQRLRLHLLKNHIKKWLEQCKIDQSKNDGKEGVQDVGGDEFAKWTSIRQDPKVGLHQKIENESVCKLRKFGF